MTQYKPFDNKRKFPRTFEKSQSNLSEIKNQNIKKLEARFRSENHYKPVTIIPIVSDYLISSGEQISVDLINYPDWAINMLQPKIIFNLDSAYNPQDDVGSLFEAFQNGTLKTGDISVGGSPFHWFTKQDNFYRFNIRLSASAQVAIVDEQGFTGISIPIFVNLSLYIINERNYNEVQSGK